MNLQSPREERLVQLASELIAIPSLSGREHAASDWVERQLRSFGMRDVHRLRVPDSADTVVARIEGDQDSDGLLLGFHVDIEELAPDWKTDPFTPRRDNEKLFGAGAHDMKAGAAAILGAVEIFLSERPRLRAPLVIAATTDEIRWSRGAHVVIQSGLLHGCLYALVGEPSPEFTFHDGCRGRHILALHYNKETEAALRVAPLAQEGERFSLRRVGDELILNAYVLPEHNVAHLVEAVRRIVGEVEMRVDPRPTPAPMAFRLPPDSRIVQTLRAAIGSRARAELTHNVCDANHFFAAGLEPVIYGPTGGNTDKADEYLEIGSMMRVAETYLRVIRQLIATTATPSDLMGAS
jgi:acetylornithine deacetylase/succinyl-diaminopimelate desuccinylase-like protein